MDRTLRHELAGDKTYLSPRAKSATPSAAYAAHLLPAYDEYNVAYKHREASVGLGPTVVLEGTATGVWTRTIDQQSVTITVTPSRSLKRSEKTEILKAAERYAAFLGLSPDVHI